MKPNLYGFGHDSFGSFISGRSKHDLLYSEFFQNFRQIYYQSASLSMSDFIGISNKGELITFGNNSNGQIGNNSTVSVDSPIRIGNFRWKKIYRGGAVGSHTIHAIREDGLLFSWGYNNYGSLGDGSIFNSRSSPVQIGNQKWIDISRRKAIRADGLLFTWGINNEGDVGDGTVEDRYSPVQIGNDTWASVFARGAIRSDGKLFQWGRGDYMPDNTGISRSSPVQIGNDNWLECRGVFSIFAIRSDGAIFAWGSNSNGMLGINSSIPLYSSPVQIGNYSDIYPDIGYNAASAIDQDFNFLKWGQLRDYSFVNGYPTLGLNSVSSPVQIGTKKVKKILSDNLCLDTDDKAVVRGDLQNIYANRNLYSNKIINLSRSIFKKISVSDTIMALDLNDNLYLWGAGAWGQMGNNTNASTNYLNTSPILLGSSKYKEICSIPNSCYAIDQNGYLFAWGLNTYGQLGLGDSVPRSSPVQIGNDKWKFISKIKSGSTSAHSAIEVRHAIREDGSLFGWGRGNTGYNLIGDLGSVARSSPVQVASGSWKMVSSSVKVVHAINSDGFLFGWGRVSSTFGSVIISGRRFYPAGLMGDGTSFVAYSSPVQIGTKKWKTVCHGAIHSLAIDEDGFLFKWGFGAGVEGAIIVSQNSGISSPVQIGTKKWKFVDAYDFTNLAIDEDDMLHVWGSLISNNQQTRLPFNEWTGNLTHSSFPVQIGNKRWMQIETGSVFTNNFSYDERYFIGLIKG